MLSHMNRHSASKRCFLSFTAVAFAVALSTVAKADTGRPPRDAACHAYDLHVLTLIEDHGLVGDTSAEDLREATFQMLKARAACREGDVNQALRLYEAINLDAVRMAPFYRVLMR
jgi:hypothetical protein